MIAQAPTYRAGAIHTERTRRDLLEGKLLSGDTADKALTETPALGLEDEEALERRSRCGGSYDG